MVKQLPRGSFGFPVAEPPLDYDEPRVRRLHHRRPRHRGGLVRRLAYSKLVHGAAGAGLGVASVMFLAHAVDLREHRDKTSALRSVPLLKNIVGKPPVFVTLNAKVANVPGIFIAWTDSEKVRKVMLPNGTPQIETYWSLKVDKGRAALAQAQYAQSNPTAKTPLPLAKSDPALIFLSYDVTQGTSTVATEVSQAAKACTDDRTNMFHAVSGHAGWLASSSVSIDDLRTSAAINYGNVVLLSDVPVPTASTHATATTTLPAHPAPQYPLLGCDPIKPPAGK